jgi:ribose 5-phosphate isomerase A
MGVPVRRVLGASPGFTFPEERLSQVSQSEALKRRAAERAADRIRDGMRLGLGTGSTVRHLIDHIAERRADGQWRDIVAVPTSRVTEEHAARVGIPLATLAECPELDLTIDGADEVDPELRLIKGLGGALLREKIVASVSRQLVIIVDESKVVDRLGTRAPLPVEVDPFGAPALLVPLRRLGAVPELRRSESGAPFISDGGHHILDCRFAEGIDDPDALDRVLRSRPGVLETGLFLGMTTEVVGAGVAGIREFARDEART